MAIANYGLLMVIYVIELLVIMAAVAAVYISRWFLFKKMQMPGWKGIIPFYSDYLLFRTFWNTKMFWVYVISAGVYAVIAVISSVVTVVFGMISMANATSQDALAGSFGALAVAAVAIYGVLTLGYLVFVCILSFKLFHRIAKAFGKSTGFAVGLTFLNPIFQMILAFDGSQCSL